MIGDLLVFNDTSTRVPEATAWGCDLTEEYVRFNADYVT